MLKINFILFCISIKSAYRRARVRGLCAYQNRLKANLLHELGEVERKCAVDRAAIREGHRRLIDGAQKKIVRLGGVARDY